MRPLRSTPSIFVFALLFFFWTVLADPSGYSERSTKVRPRSLNFHENINGRVSSYHVTSRVAKHRRELARKFREKRSTGRNSTRRRAQPPPRPTDNGVPYRPPPVRSTAEHHQYRKHKRDLYSVGSITSGLTSRQQSNPVCDDSTAVPPSFDGSCSAGAPCPNGACW